MQSITLRPLFTKFLNPGLTCKLCNKLDDWLQSTNFTNNPAGYIIHGLNRELKNWVNKALSQSQLKAKLDSTRI